MQGGKKKLQDVPNAAGEMPVSSFQRRVRSNYLYIQLPRASFKGHWKERVRGEACCSDLALEGGNQSLLNRLSSLTHAGQQHRVRLVLHFVEWALLQVLWHACHLVVLPPVNSGEEAAELPGLGGDREGERNRGGKTDMLVKTEEDFQKNIYMSVVGMHYLYWLVKTRPRRAAQQV